MSQLISKYALQLLAFQNEILRRLRQKSLNELENTFQHKTGRCKKRVSNK